MRKSLELESLSLDETVALLRVRNEEDRKLILKTANDVKKKIYGDRIVLTAPLHVDNHCASDCLYCAFRPASDQVRRARLDAKELREAGKKLMSQGHKRIVLVSGQTEKPDMDYFANAIDILSRLFDASGKYVASISISAR